MTAARAIPPLPRSLQNAVKLTSTKLENLAYAQQLPIEFVGGWGVVKAGNVEYCAPAGGAR